MKTTVTDQAEVLNEGIKNNVQRSKATIDSAIKLNSKQREIALDSNNPGFAALNNILRENKIDPDIINSVRKLITEEVKLTEEITNSIIDSFTSQINMNIVFASKFLELINSGKLNTDEGREKLAGLIRTNFTQTAEHSLQNLEKMISLYASQINSNIALAETLAENLTAQILSISEQQSNGLDSFYNWGEMLNPWWKFDGSQSKQI